MSLWHRTIPVRPDFKIGVTQSHGPLKDGQTPLVFLHGWSVSALAYTEVLENLEDRGFYVIAFDAPDHGRSSSLKWGHTVKDMAEVIHHAMFQINVTEPAVIVGHSMGGAIAVEYAAMYPGFVSAAILLDPAAGKHHHDTLRMGFTPAAAVRVAEMLTGAARDVFGDACLATESRSGRELLSLGSRLAKSLSGARILRAGVALLLSDTWPALDALYHYGVPTVIIHGSDDRIVPEKAIRQAAVTSGARYEILTGYNHSWMISAPEEAALRISEWANRIAGNTLDWLDQHRDRAAYADAGDAIRAWR